MEKEIWKDIIGYEELYQISNCGRVRAIMFRNGTTNKKQIKNLKPTDNGNGYLIICLYKNNKRKNYYIHRLVGIHFIKQKNDKKIINHKDFNKQNNNYKNLEWVNQKENTLYSKNNMSVPKKTKTKSISGEKYIYFRKNRYRLSLSIPNKNFNIDRLFKTIEEAICLRNKILKEYNYE